MGKCILLTVLWASSALVTPSLVSAEDRAAALTWQWSDDDADLMRSVYHNGEFCQIEVIRPKGTFADLKIRFTDKGRVLFERDCHAHTVFRVIDGNLYFADFDDHSDGCKLVAVDLGAGKILWETELKALGGVKHSKYRNRVNLVDNGDVLTVFGHESAGRYVEQVDRKTGKTVAHKIFDAK